MTNDKAALEARALIGALLQGPKTHPALDEWNKVETPHGRECLNAALEARARVEAVLKH
jgi:hypothetical protein